MKTVLHQGRAGIFDVTEMRVVNSTPRAVFRADHPDERLRGVEAELHVFAERLTEPSLWGEFVHPATGRWSATLVYRRECGLSEPAQTDACRRFRKWSGVP